MPQPCAPTKLTPAFRRTFRRSTRQRGMAVALTLILLLGIMTIMLVGLAGLPGSGGTQSSGGTVTTAGNALQLTASRAQAATAAETAASGVELTLQWLHAQPSPPAQTTAFAPALWGASLSGNPQRAVVAFPNSASPAGTFSVLIYPDSGNAAAVQKKYMIESIGTSGTAVQIVRAYIQQASFANFGYFSDNSAPDAYWTSGVSAFDGPVHCNNSDGTATNIIWKSGSTTPLFLDTDLNAVTMSGPAIHWFQGTPQNPAAPQSSSDWLSLAAGGQSSVHVGTPVIPFPTSSAVQMQAALSGQAAPTQIGVFVPSTGGSLLLGVLSGASAAGGIYIHGDITQMTLAVSAAATQVITVNQTDQNAQPLTTVITLNPALNTTTVSTTRIQNLLPVVSLVSYSGATNDVVYCDGNIGSQTLPKSGGLNGVVADNQISNLGGLLGQSRLTIATAADKNININGSLTYNTSRLLGNNGVPLPEILDPIFAQKAGTLGLISKDIEIVDNSALGLPLTNVEVDAAALAYDTFDATDANTRPSGKFISMGSFLVGHGSAFGKLNSGSTLQTGLSTQRFYDGRLAVNPPPQFPAVTTNYDILSWSATAQPLGN